MCDGCHLPTRAVRKLSVRDDLLPCFVVAHGHPVHPARVAQLVALAFVSHKLSRWRPQ